MTSHHPHLIFPGDHPDPTVLRVGETYYATFSSFVFYPGLVLWHSRDLVHWTRVGPTLFRDVGPVWAPELVHHGGRYFIYFATAPRHAGIRSSNYVIWSDDVHGRWSDPIDLGVEGIDPGHVVDQQGQRFLFLSGGERVRLAHDGLSTIGRKEKVFDGWRYPDEWVVETFALEGPKLLRRGEVYHLICAQGGTAGPPTSHMVVSARAADLAGPWEHSPYNPIVRTQNAEERWWSAGHGSLVEGPAGTWWMLYHAYENGYRTLGRQTLLTAIDWTADGWFRVAARRTRLADCPAAPLTSPSVENGWQLYASTDLSRVRSEAGRVTITARGDSPADASPLTCVAGDYAYEISARIDVDAGVTAGLLLFYSRRLYAGLGFSTDDWVLHNAGEDLRHARDQSLGTSLYLRLRNDHHIVTMHYSVDGVQWRKYDRVLEVSGYHHNVAYDFLSLRPAIYASGRGEARVTQFCYRAL